MNKNPAKRPSLAQLMKDPFFAEIDWDKLERKELEPPQILKKEDSEGDESDMTFDSQDDQAGGQKRRPILVDSDYTEKNKNVFRLKSYSFVRD